MKISFSKQTKERAFKQLYEEYYAPFCLYAKRFVDDKETREDIVSDVFTSLWDKLDTDSSIEHRISLHQNVRKK